LHLGLTDKIVCVAGSTRGIGRSIADAFLREGARVAVTGRIREDLERTSHELAAEWGKDRILAIQGDLTREAEIEECIQTIRKQWGGMDGLVATLGSGQGKMGWQPERSEWTRLLDWNLVGSSLLAGAAVPLLDARGGGTITFVSSLAGTEVLPAPVPYTCAKAGLVALSKTLSRMLAGRQIRVNAVAPGNILFPGGVWQRKLDENADQVKTYIDTEVPMKRLGTPDEVADAVVFLASSRASFITGACLLIDGGQSHGW
jgi:3-oxoacyl-[acyl-carrier protein] reductase